MLFNIYLTESIMNIFSVPTYYMVYKITNLEKGLMEFIIEFKSKGAAIKWINKHAVASEFYTVVEGYKKK